MIAKCCILLLVSLGRSLSEVPTRRRYELHQASFSGVHLGSHLPRIPGLGLPPMVPGWAIARRRQGMAGTFASLYPGSCTPLDGGRFLLRTHHRRRKRSLRPSRSTHVTNENPDCCFRVCVVALPAGGRVDVLSSTSTLRQRQRDNPLLVWEAKEV